MEEIKKLREVYTAAELAQLLGVTRAMIYHYEDGKHEPSFRTNRRIKEILQINKLK